MARFVSVGAIFLVSLKYQAKTALELAFYSRPFVGITNFNVIRLQIPGNLKFDSFFCKVLTEMIGVQLTDTGEFAPKWTRVFPTRR